MSAAATPAVVGFIAILGLFCAQRHGGARLGGFVSGLPLVSLPCAVMVGLTGGSESLKAALLGAIVATGASAFTMMLLGRLHRHASLPAGVVIMLLLTASVCSGLSDLGGVSPASAAALSTALLAISAVASRRQSETPALSGVNTANGRPRALAFPILVAALGSYALTVGVFSFAGSFWAGVFSSAPILGAFAIMFGVKQGGHGNVARVANGYTLGSIYKFGMLAVGFLATTLVSMA